MEAPLLPLRRPSNRTSLFSEHGSPCDRRNGKCNGSAVSAAPADDNCGDFNILDPWGAPICLGGQREKPFIQRGKLKGKTRPAPCVLHNA